MYNPQASFRNILSPVTADDFFADYLDKKPLHIPGDPDKFDGLFDWDELTRLLDLQERWTGDNLSLVAEMRKLSPDHYCVSEQRPTAVVMAPDRDKVESYLQQGATMVLDRMESYAAGTNAIAASLRLALGWPVEGNLYCSWKGSPGFRPHFDTMDVFAVHFEGEKTWDIYSSRFALPFRAAGYNYESFPPDHHAENLGEKEMEVHMKPGDVLYIPKGKYHAALATSEASLHITFGIMEMRAVQCIQMIYESLPDDPLFRTPIPRFLRGEDLATFVADVGERMAEILKRPTVAAEMSDELRAQAWGALSGFAFPRQARSACYRVETVQGRLVRRGKKWQLTTGDGKADLSPADAKLAEWMLLSDAFAVDDLEAAFPMLSAAEREAALERLTAAGLIQRL